MTGTGLFSHVPPESFPVIRGYRLLHEVGTSHEAGPRNGKTKVFKAARPDSDQFFAVKVIDIHRGDPAYGRWYAVTESEILKRIQSPRVVSWRESGLTEDSSEPYIATEFLSGGNLAGFLADQQALRGFDLSRVLYFSLQALECVCEIWRHGILHCDVRPENFVLNEDRTQLKVIDFGYARYWQGLRGVEEQASFGTSFYMPLESFKGKHDQSRDIYSSAVMIYELLTGKNPFETDTIHGVYELKKVHAVPPPSRAVLPRKIPPQLDEVILAAMAQRPGDRYQIPDDFHRDLSRVISEMGVDMRPPLTSRY